MAYTILDARIGTQPIDVTDTTARHPLGSIVTAADPTYGTGEFIYLKGLASTAVGSCRSRRWAACRNCARSIRTPWSSRSCSRAIWSVQTAQGRA